MKSPSLTAPKSYVGSRLVMNMCACKICFRQQKASHNNCCDNNDNCFDDVLRCSCVLVDQGVFCEHHDVEAEAVGHFEMSVCVCVCVRVVLCEHID